VENFHRIDVYQKAVVLSRDVADLVTRFPQRYSRLAQQLDDAAESIGSNIAEGCGRRNRSNGNAELIRYLHMSFGSACEVEHRLGGAHHRRLIDDATYARLNGLVIEVKRMLCGWIRSLRDDDRGRQ